MIEHLVIIQVLCDDDDLPWWKALNLPSPDRWSLEETFGEEVLPSVVLEKEIMR